MLKYLELAQIVSETVTRLQDMTPGAIVYRPYFNVFLQQRSNTEFDEYLIDREGKIVQIDDDCVVAGSIEKFKLDIDIVLHRVQLNDLIEWLHLTGLGYCKTSKTELMLCQRSTRFCRKWDLSKSLLEHQSEELIDFLLRIAKWQ